MGTSPSKIGYSLSVFLALSVFAFVSHNPVSRLSAESRNRLDTHQDLAHAHEEAARCIRDGQSIASCEALLTHYPETDTAYYRQ